MHALVTVDTGTADQLIARARQIGAESGEPDLEAVVHSLAASRARRAGARAAARGRVGRALHQAAGPGWVVGRDGATTVMPDLKGLRYLHHLLQRPGVDVGAPDLAAAASGHAGTVVPELGGGELIDTQALTAYRGRLRDIDSELAEAESWADQARLARLRVERDALLHELGAATGLAGRRRRFGSAGERARVAVRKAIAAALARIELHDAALARLLRDTVRTGAACRYDPDPARPVTWLLDPGAASPGNRP
jgi:hypothetical protein